MKSVPINIIPIWGNIPSAVTIAVSVVSVQAVGDPVEVKGPVLILTELADQFRLQSCMMRPNTELDAVLELELYIWSFSSLQLRLFFKILLVIQHYCSDFSFKNMYLTSLSVSLRLV